jgi:hypothetical protein
MVGMDKLGGQLAAPRKPRDTEVFRSPVAAVVWWVWLLFAVANLIDLAVQGRDHLSVVAAGTLLVVTGVVYVTAQRPKIVAEDDGLTIVNPLRDHRVGWAAVAGYDTTDLLRIRCAWDAGGERKRAIYSWAVHSSRRKAVVNEIRAQQRGQRGISRPGGMGGRGPFGGYATPPDNAPPPRPLGLDADTVVAALNARADKVRAVTPEAVAGPPVSAWQWPAIAAVIIPVLVLLIAILVLRVGGAGAEPFDVVGGGAGLYRGVNQDRHPPGGGEPALVGVEYVQPGEYVPVEGLHPDLDLAVEAEVNPVPAVEFLLVDLGNVVERDEYPLRGVLHHGGEGAVPAEFLATESQAPALEPSAPP